MHSYVIILPFLQGHCSSNDNAIATMYGLQHNLWYSLNKRWIKTPKRKKKFQVVFWKRYMVCQCISSLGVPRYQIDNVRKFQHGQSNVVMLTESKPKCRNTGKPTLQSPLPWGFQHSQSNTKHFLLTCEVPA